MKTHRWGKHRYRPRPPRGSEFVRNDDLPAARAGGEHVEQTEGPSCVLRPGSHRHLALRVYDQAYPQELTATEAGQLATPLHDRVTGGTRRTYDLRQHDLVVRGKRGFTITDKGRNALALLEGGTTVRLEGR